VERSSTVGIVSNENSGYHRDRLLAMQRRVVLKMAGAAAAAFGQRASGMNLFGGALTAEEVVTFPLPDALTFASGKRVTKPGEWKQRRKELVETFAERVYGRTPRQPADLSLEHSVAEHGAAFNGVALRKQVTIRVSRGAEQREIHVLLYLPAKRDAPVPVFTGLNFEGNHAANADPQILLSETWKRDPADTAPGPNNERRKLVKQKAAESGRGQAASRWQAEKIVQRCCGLATAYYGDIEPDFAGGIQHGVRPLFFNARQQQPSPGDWGALGAWGWG
jgi:hypothetical protein